MTALRNRLCELRRELLEKLESDFLTDWLPLLAQIQTAIVACDADAVSREPKERERGGD